MKRTYLEIVRLEVERRLANLKMFPNANLDPYWIKEQEWITSKEFYDFIRIKKLSEKKRLVTLITELRDEGRKTNEISRILNVRNIKTVNGKSWTPRTVLRY